MTGKKTDDPAQAERPDGPFREEFFPPLDFSSIVLPIFTQALLKLGLLGDQEKPEAELNVELARRMIDILDLLKDRTKGNLTPEEERFLESCLQQLKAGYLEKAKIITL